MIISDEVKRILSNNDFSRTNNSSLSTNKQMNSKELSRNQSPIKRKVLKIKITLSLEMITMIKLILAFTQQLNFRRQKLNTIQFPLINSSDQQLVDNNSKTLYQAVIEIFPLEHEIWKDLVEQNQTIEEVVNNNAEYFQSILKVCQCKLELAQQDLLNKNINFNEIKYYQPKNKQLNIQEIILGLNISQINHF